MINFIIQRILNYTHVYEHGTKPWGFREKDIVESGLLPYSNTEGQTLLWARAKIVKFSILTCLVGKPYQ